MPALKQLLKWDVDFSVRDKHGNTVHHFAAETNKEIVSVMILMDFKLIGFNERIHGRSIKPYFVSSYYIRRLPMVLTFGTQRETPPCTKLA